MKQSYKIAVPLAAFALIATGALGTYAYQSHAQTTDTQVQGGQMRDQSQSGHVGQNGIKEELLTGDIAEKAKAAALAAVQGGTIQRVETDAEGDKYEAHMTDSSGQQVTVKMDENFKVTNTETGRGGHR
jgi:hypothetical protein